MVAVGTTRRRTASTEDATSSPQRVTEILLALGGDEALESDGLGVTRIADLVGREKSQVSRALKALAGTGLVDRDPATLGYRLGWRLFALAARAGSARLTAAAPPVLATLVGVTGETAHLAVLTGSEVLTVMTEAPATAVRAAGWVGRRVPAWCTASGRALLFDSTEAEVRARFAGVVLDPLGPGTVRDLDELLARLVADEARGVAIADEELEPGLVAVAAPVRDASGRVVASLNVSAPKFRLGTRLEAAGATVLAAAGDLSLQLGHAPPAAERAAS